MSRLIKIEDDGFIEVQLGDVSKTLDLYEVNNHIVDLYRPVEGEEPGESSPTIRVIDYLVSLGFPKVSQRSATLFINSIFNTVDDLKKKDVSVASPLMNVDSQNSTDSQSLD